MFQIVVPRVRGVSRTPSGLTIAVSATATAATTAAAETTTASTRTRSTLLRLVDLDGPAVELPAVHLAHRGAALTVIIEAHETEAT